MHQMQFLLLVTEPRAGWANGRRIRWEDVDDGSDGVAARPHGRMVNRTRDELTKTAQSKAVFDLASLGGIHKMESGCGLLFVGYRASFDCSDPLTPRSQLAALASGVFSRARCGERLHPSTSFAWSQRAHLGSQSQRPRSRRIGACPLRSGYLRACDDGMPLCSLLVACRQP